MATRRSLLWRLSGYSAAQVPCVLRDKVPSAVYIAVVGRANAHQGRVDQPSRPCDAVLAVYTFRSLMPPIRSAFFAVTCAPESTVQSWHAACIHSMCRCKRGGSNAATNGSGFAV